MEIKTKFSNGDIVYGIQNAYSMGKIQVIGPMTIGQVRVEITDSPGIEGEEMFDNYKPQQEYKEQYMCVETGVGTGTLHYVENLFTTKELAKAAADKKQKELDAI